MSISLGAAAVGALISLVFTGMLVRRCVRLPRMANVALCFAAAGLTASLAAQAVGYDRGFSQNTFRAVQLGAQLIAPLALVWALSEFTSKSLGARFAARLGLGALTVIGGVVLATDPLASAGFSKNWPAASVHYQLIPNWVLEAIAVVTALFAVIAVIVAGVRGRQSPGWRTLFLAVAAVAAAAVATDWLHATLPVSTLYPASCLLAAVLAWFGAWRASAVRLESLRSGGYSWDEDTGSFIRYNEDTGEFGYADDTGGFGRVRGGTDGRGWYADDTGGFRGGTDGGFRRDPADTDFSGWFRPGEDTGSFRRVADPAGPGLSGQGMSGQGMSGQGMSSSGLSGPDPGGPATGAIMRDPGMAGAGLSGPGLSGPGLSGPGLSGPDPGGPATGAIMRDPGDGSYSQYGVMPPETGRSGRGQNGTAGHNQGGHNQAASNQAASNQVAYVETGDVMAILDSDGYPQPSQLPGEETSRLYGQIAIYTLLDESADDFERLASEVVEQVKTREPDTLVYVMHGVPAAPMQRILYAVYRDEAAYDEHERQPYIRQFEEEREPFVLATNVIELGVKQGKFAPTGGTRRRPLVRKARPRSGGGR